MAEMADYELDEETMQQVAGGNDCTFCPCQNDYAGRLGCELLGKK